MPHTVRTDTDTVRADEMSLARPRCLASAATRARLICAKKIFARKRKRQPKIRLNPRKHKAPTFARIRIPFARSAQISADPPTCDLCRGDLCESPTTTPNTDYLESVGATL